MVTVSNTGELSSSSSRYNEVRLPLDDTKNHVTAATEVVEAEDKSRGFYIPYRRLQHHSWNILDFLARTFSATSPLRKRRATVKSNKVLRSSENMLVDNITA